MVLVAIIGTIRIALSQPDQPATIKTQSDRTPSPVGARPTRAPESARRTAASPATTPASMTPAMPAGFQWIEAGPVPRFRSGFALLVVLAVVGALLAMAVAGLAVAAAAALGGSLG